MGNVVNKLCECGCGNPAPIAKRSRKERGIVKGEHVRFISGHNTRLVSVDEQSRRAKMQKGIKRGPRRKKPDASFTSYLVFLGKHQGDGRC